MRSAQGERNDMIHGRRFRRAATEAGGAIFSEDVAPVLGRDMASPAIGLSESAAPVLG